MAGIQVSVQRRLQQGPPNITSSSATTPLAQLIDTLGWKSGQLIVRVFAANIGGTSSSGTINVFNQMVGPDDPATVFTEATALATATIDPNVGAGRLIIVPLTSGTGIISRFLAVTLTWTAGSGGITGTATFSVDLLGRDT